MSSLAKLTWTDPTDGLPLQYVLEEGASASIGRSAENDLCIPERHVSRHHAVIAFQDGLFVLQDLGSANGTFVNDDTASISRPFPLVDGDRIRLFVPMILFSAATPEDQAVASTTGHVIMASTNRLSPLLQVTAGPNEGAEFILTQEVITIGRAVNNATWDIPLQDEAISRPHCRLQKSAIGWAAADLNSANHTYLNNVLLGSMFTPIRDGDVLMLGRTTILFRQG